MKVIKIGLICLIWLIIPLKVHAQEFKTDYQVEYFLNEDQGKIQTAAKFIIKITNFTSDKYVKKFSMSFPKTFQIRNVKATDEKGPVTPQLDTT